MGQPRATTTSTRGGDQEAARGLRVAFFTETAAFGGMERHILALVDGLDRSAYEPILYCNLREEARPFVDEMALREVEVRFTNGSEGRATDGEEGGVRLLRWLWRRVPWAGLKRALWFRAQTKAAAHLLRGRGLDLIHFHAGNLEAIAPAMAAAAQLQIPRRILTMSNPFGLRTGGSLVGRLHGRAVRSIHAVVAVSEAVRRHLVRGLGLPAERITVIPLGVGPRPLPSGTELDRARRDLGLSETALVVGTVARLAPEKALHVLLEAMVWVKAAVPAARCLIVGDGPCRAGLQRLAGRLGVDGMVTFAGERRDGAALIPLFDVAVLPSVSEGLPLFLLEAMAAGKPVVATRVGGVPEVVCNGRSGLLVPAGDPTRLAGAIILVLRHRFLGRRMGEAGLRRVRERFSRGAMLARTLALYHGGAREARPVGAPGVRRPVGGPAPDHRRS